MFEGIWTTNLDYVTFYWIWTGKLLDSVIFTLVRYFTDVGLENIWTTIYDYNYYILRYLDFKILGLWILILIIIYLTGFGLENTWSTN